MNKDVFTPSVQGVGFMGEGKYTSCENRRNTLAYSRWSGMLARCYSEAFQKRNPTYIGCSVAAEWHNFQVFAEWFYKNHPGDGNEYCLDKDIRIPGNKIYSPEACSFVTRAENTRHAKNKR